MSKEIIIPESKEWNLKGLIPEGGVEGFIKEWEKLKEEYEKFINKWKDRKDYLEKPEVLKEALDEYEELAKNYGNGGREAYYYWLKNKQDQEDNEVKAIINKIEEKLVKLSNELQFFMMRIAKIPAEEQKKFLEYEGLKEYKHLLEMSFRDSKHLLSEEQEKIMRLKGTTSYDKWVEMVERMISKEVRTITDEEGKNCEKNFEELMSMISSTNKKVRDEAAKNVNEILKGVSDTATEEINAILTNKRVDDELRGFTRPDEERHLSDDIETEVVDKLVEAVTENFDIAKEYYELKAKLLGLEKLAYHERNVTYITGKEEQKYDYDKGIRTVEKVMKNFNDGEELLRIFKDFVEKGLIDVMPKKGKHGGAFCIHWNKNVPTYILLNYTNRLRDVTTIAHECGHGINNELIRKKENSLNFGTPTSTAEVASTFMEDYVIRELLKDNEDEELKMEVMMNKLNDEISSIIRQIACYNYEKELHEIFREKGYLSKEVIGEMFKKHMSAYMGEFVEQNPGSENWWVYWGHIRRFFYNYSYASGLLISKYLQRKVNEKPEFINEVKEFLSTGTSKSPKEIFEGMGININDKEFWNEGMKEIRTLLEETKELAKKLGKI